MAPKRALFFFLSPIQCGLSDTCPAPISTMFETTDINWCAGVYTGQKLPNFRVGVLQALELPPEAVFWSGVLVARVQLKHHNFG